MADKRWRGAVFDVALGISLALGVSSMSIWLAVPFAGAGWWILKRGGVL